LEKSAGSFIWISSIHRLAIGLKEDTSVRDKLLTLEFPPWKSPIACMGKRPEVGTLPFPFPPRFRELEMGGKDGEIGA
jgi:hypothetical protein